MNQSKAKSKVSEQEPEGVDIGGIETVYNHYTASVSYLRALVRSRIFMVWAILGILALMLFQGTDPGNSKTLIDAVKLKPPGAEIDLGPLDPRLVNSTLWALFVIAVVQAYQRSLLLELQAVYVKNLESRLDALLGGNIIGRERLERPIFFRRAVHFYFGVLAGLMFFVPFGKICLEAVVLPSLLADSSDVYSARGPTVLSFLFDVAMFLIFIYYSWHFKADHERMNPLLANTKATVVHPVEIQE